MLNVTYETPSHLTFVAQLRNPQPCFAVMVACFAPRSTIDSIHCVVLSCAGQNVEALFVGPAAYDAFFAQFSALHPGSPFCANVAMLKWISAIISWCWYVSCGPVGTGGTVGAGVGATHVSPAAYVGHADAVGHVTMYFIEVV